VATRPFGHHHVTYGLCSNLGLRDGGHSLLESEPTFTPSLGRDGTIRPVVAQLFSRVRLNRIFRGNLHSLRRIPHNASPRFHTCLKEHWPSAAAIDFDLPARSSDQPICPGSTRWNDHTAQHRFRFRKAAAVLIPSESNMSPFTFDSRGLPGLRTPKNNKLKRKIPHRHL